MGELQSDELYVIFASNGSSDTHPHNTLTDFVNVLPRDVTLPNKYKIALQGLSFNANFTNVPNNVSSAKYVGYAATHNEYISNKETTAYVGATFPFRIYTSFEDLQRSLDEFKLTIENGLGRGKFGTAKPSTLHEDAKINSFKLAGINIALWLHKGFCEWLQLPINLTRGTKQFEGTDYVLFVFPDEVASRYTSGVHPDILPTIYPSHVKVILEELQPALSSWGHHKDLAVVPLSDIQIDSGRNFYFEVKRKEYLPISEPTLTKVRIRLVDEFNQQLALLPGQPTFVKVKLKKLNMNSFMLRLSSADSKDLFSDNTNSSFRLQLPHPIDLNHEPYEVAVSTVHYPSIVNGLNSLNVDNFWVEFPTDDGVSRFDCSGNSGTGSLPIRDKEALLLAINMYTYTYFRSSRIRFFIAEGDRVFITLHGGKQKVRISALLARVLGHEGVPSHGSYDEVALIAEGERLYYGSSVNYDRLTPHSILLYSNLGKPIIVGSTYAKVLKLIPIEKRTHVSVTSYESKHLDYIPLSENVISNLEFGLHDSAGLRISFGNDRPVLINLLFRKIMNV